MKRCSQCKSKNLILSEVWKGYVIQFWQNKAGIAPDGIVGDVVNPHRVEAECRDCGHQWTLRGITQITDITYYNAAAK